MFFLSLEKCRHLVVDVLYLQRRHVFCFISIIAYITVDAQQR